MFPMPSALLCFLLSIVSRPVNICVVVGVNTSHAFVYELVVVVFSVA